MASEQAFTAFSQFLAVKAVFPSFFQSSADFQTSISTNTYEQESICFIIQILSRILENSLQNYEAAVNTLSVFSSNECSFNLYFQCEPIKSLKITNRMDSIRTNISMQATLIKSQSILKSYKQKIYNIKLLFLMSRATNSTKLDITIKRQYLVKSNYEFAKENNQKLNFWYDQLCNIFISHFQILGGVKPDPNYRKSQRDVVTDSKHYEFTKYLRNFMLDFTNIMKDISNFQINRLHNLKNDNEPQLEVYSSLIEQVTRNKKDTDDIEVNQQAITDMYRDVKSSIQSYKRNLENPFNLYNPKYVEENSKKINNAIEETSKIIQKTIKQRQVIKERVPKFQADYSKFKCKLVKNKYKILKKLMTFIQNSKYCIVEMTELFKNCALNHKNLFLKVFQNSQDDITELRQLLNRTASQEEPQSPSRDNKRWQQAIKSTLDVYSLQNQQVQKAVSKLSEYFVSSLKNHEESKLKLREIINNLCQFYDPNESPYEQLIEIYNINQKLQKKFDIILQRLNDITQMIRKSRKQCLKQGEIVLSLIKMKTQQGKVFIQNKKNAKNKDIIEFVNELTFTHTKQHILSFYESCIMTQTELLDAIKITVKPKRKTLDSMEVSHSMSTNKYLVQRKKPVRQEYWLWKDFKEETNMNFDHYLNFFNDFKKFSEDLSNKFPTKSSIELEQYKCTLSNRKKQGTLTLYADNLLITAKQVTICILWKDILNIQETSSFFNKSIVIITSQGKIQLTKFNVDESIVIAAMKDIKERKEMGEQPKITAKKVIELSPQQLKQIQVRKADIMDKVPKTNNFRLIVEETFENERIDEFYEMIYSDKPFTFYGRQQPCFFSYTGKKGGNFNWVAQKYDKPGPEFYSLVEGVNFSNCPLFSTRKITYNHPMKPSNIPFMPKQSRNADQRLMYWVSHDELIYLIKSLTFQIPFSDVFEVQLLHRITQSGSNVKLEIYSQVVFVKDTSFQSIILKNTDPELDENMLSFMAQVKKLIKLKKQAAKGVVIPVQPEPQTAGPVHLEKDEVAKLKTYNKILVVGLTFLVLLSCLALLS